MTLTLLQIFFIISGVIIFLISLDIAKRQKFNALHFIVFLAISVGMLVLSIFPNVLNKLWNVFGLQRGADVLVYASIIFLFYFVLLLLNKVEKNREDLTRVIREMALLEDKILRKDGK